jgi:membrane protein CcdC involved in cytochrome C biogenesis
MDASPQTLGPIIGVGIALVVVLLRNRAARPLNVQWMWVVPLLVSLLIGWGIWASTTFQPHAPFGPITYASLAAALAAGCAIGWWRGKTIDIHRDPDTGKLMARASPLGLIILIGLIAVRYAMKGVLEANAEAWHLNMVALTDGFLLFAAGLVVVSRVEMWLRARAIAEHPQTV